MEARRWTSSVMRNTSLIAVSKRGGDTSGDSAQTPQRPETRAPIPIFDLALEGVRLFKRFASTFTKLQLKRAPT